MADLMAALRNADAAGDTEAASRIAAMIKAQGATPTPDAEQPGMLSQVGRQLGLTGRYAVEGVGNLLGMVSDPIGQSADALIPRKQTVAGLIQGQDNTPRYQRTGGDGCRHLSINAKR